MSERREQLLEKLRHYQRGGSGPINDACAEAAEEIENLCQALEDVTAHKPGTPGLHYDSLAGLIDSAVGVAKAALQA